MKWVMKTAVIGLAGFLAAMATSQAQVQQSISFTMTVFNQTDTGIQSFRIGNKGIVENLVGSNVPNARLVLVMPSDPSPDGSGNIGAFLRVTDSHGNILAETDTSTFNIYQTVSSQTPTRIVAFNQFSIDFGGLSAELFGTGTWTRRAGGGHGQGSFHSNVTGHCALTGTTDGAMPCSGSISGGPTRPSQ